MNDTKIWQDWTILLWAIVREHLVSSPLSQQFISTHHLPATSSVKTALKALVDKQLVSKTPTGYLVSDRFFAKWLERGGIIANWGNENCVPMQHLLRPDAAKDASRRNFRSVLAPIKRASFASCTSLYKFIRFIEVTDTTSLGDGYDFAGWRIRLCWVTDSTALGDGFDCVGWKRQFRWLNEALEVAEWKFRKI